MAEIDKVVPKNDGFELLGYKTVFNDAAWLDYVSWVILIGFIASCQSFLFCTGRLIYAMARDGLFPHQLSYIHPKLGTPFVSLIAASVLSYGLTLGLYFINSDDDQVGPCLINLTLFGNALETFEFVLTPYSNSDRNLIRSYMLIQILQDLIRS